jgi:hypothetical protein
MEALYVEEFQRQTFDVSDACTHPIVLAFASSLMMSPT